MVQNPAYRPSVFSQGIIHDEMSNSTDEPGRLQELAFLSFTIKTNL